MASRPERPIRLVVSDIDGTLVTREKVVTPRARAAIESCKARGIGFAVASARPPLGLRRLIEDLGIEVPVGAVNGGAIVRPDLSIVEKQTIPPDASRRAIAILRREGIDPWLFTDDRWFLRDPNGAHVDHEARTIGLDPTVVTEFSEEQIADALKLVGASHDHAHLGECERILQAELTGRALATRSQSYYLDIVNPAVNKGEAVTGIARHCKVPLSDVLTIGDGANDTPMFLVGGFSVAMGNASDAVKNLADVVTDTNEDEGFARAIERFVLGREDQA